jgi:hypothetical protein
MTAGARHRHHVVVARPESHDDSDLLVVFVGPLLACFEQLAATIRRRGVRTVWIGYPYGAVRRIRARLFMDEVHSAGDVARLAKILRRVGAADITDIQASEHVLVDTVAAAEAAGVGGLLLEELRRRLRFGDKLVASQALATAGIPVPRALDGATLTPAEAAGELGLPLVVKGRMSNGGASVCIARSVSEASKAAERAALLGGVMYEEHVVGQTTSYAASYGADGRVHHDGVYRTSQIGHDDIAPPDQVHTVENPEHLATGRAVLALVGGSGLLNLNLLEDASGRGWVHDLNLRPWGTVIALREAGVDFAEDYVRIHRGLGPRREDGSLPAGVEAQIFPSAVLGAANRSLLAALRLYLRLAPRYRRWTSLGYLVAETARSAGIVVRDRFRRPMPLPAAHESPAAAPEAPWCGR